VVFVVLILTAMHLTIKLFVRVSQLILEILSGSVQGFNMNVKQTATVEGTLSVLTMNAKILMNAYKAEDHVHSEQCAQTCLVDINAVAQLAWMGIHIIKDVDKCVKNVEGMKTVNLLKHATDTQENVTRFVIDLEFVVKEPCALLLIIIMNVTVHLDLQAIHT
jgi:hypothetical protein